ncbi:senescence associated protein [Echinococcus multilocularis]|uniref:Senescence associated protein n=1 Tax=Echinococcus multilocularis TaxID=6211 RepID=A0A0S4MIT8_ECHMU|nr:senescence associated protein [Echinococcus multilocularis]
MGLRTSSSRVLQLTNSSVLSIKIRSFIYFSPARLFDYLASKGLGEHADGGVADGATSSSSPSPSTVLCCLLRVQLAEPVQWPCFSPMDGQMNGPIGSACTLIPQLDIVSTPTQHHEHLMHVVVVHSLASHYQPDHPRTPQHSSYARRKPANGKCYSCLTMWQAAVYRCTSGRDSDLEAFSLNPSDGTPAPLADRPGTCTKCLNLRFLSY